MAAEGLLQQVRPVVRHNHEVLVESGGEAGGAGVQRRGALRPELVRRRPDGEHHLIVVAVKVPFEL